MKLFTMKTWNDFVSELAKDIKCDGCDYNYPPEEIYATCNSAGCCELQIERQIFDLLVRDEEKLKEFEKVATDYKAMKEDWSFARMINS